MHFSSEFYVALLVGLLFWSAASYPSIYFDDEDEYYFEHQRSKRLRGISYERHGV